MSASGTSVNESDLSTAPYVPFKSFLTALDRLRQPHPPVLDPSIWHSFSGGLQRQMFAAFKFLSLVDKNGAIQPKLQPLVDADDRRHQVSEMLKQAYSDLFSIGLTHATQNQFADALRKYNVSGSTHKKASSFFLQAAKFAQIQLSAGIQDLSRPGASAGPRKRRGNNSASARDPGDENEAASDQAGAERGSSRTIALRGGGKATLSFDVDVWSMTPEDQEFVFGMIKRMTEYENFKNASNQNS